MGERVLLYKLPDRGETAEDFSKRRGREIAEEAIHRASAAPARQPIAKIASPAPAAPPSAADLSKRVDNLAKSLAELESITATNRAHDATKLIAKGDLAGAQAIFKAEPRAYDAYMAGVRGETYRVPVAKTAPQDNHRPAIRELLQKGASGVAELGKLLREPGAHEQYQAMMATGETQALAADVTKRAQRQPADVSEAEKAPFKQRILAAWGKGDSEASQKAKADLHGIIAKDVRAQAAWIDLVTDGKVQPAT